nr:MAG TPA: hypothetical protein [Caudoviricetes sp.]
MGKIRTCDGQGCKERKACLRYALSHTESDRHDIFKARYYTTPNGRGCPIMIRQENDMKEDMTALVLRHIPERVPRTKSELADIYLTELNKIETDRMKSRERKRDDEEVTKSRYDNLIADKEAQLTELQDEIETLRHEMLNQFAYASAEEERRNQELADRRKVLDMWFETMRNRIEKEQENSK